MILCVCKGVSDKKVQAAVDEGCRTVKQVGSKCSAGTDCGICARAIHDMLHARNARHQDRLAAK
jgi:bacterioferritin-associated ferredoxin